MAFGTEGKTVFKSIARLRACSMVEQRGRCTWPCMENARDLPVLGRALNGLHNEGSIGFKVSKMSFFFANF